MSQPTTEVTPVFYDVQNPHYRFAIGQIEVIGHKISRATPAYRWSIGLELEQFLNNADRQGFSYWKRFVPSKSLGTVRVPIQHVKPTDIDLYCRVSP